MKKMNDILLQYVSKTMFQYSVKYEVLVKDATFYNVMGGNRFFRIRNKTYINNKKAYIGTVSYNEKSVNQKRILFEIDKRKYFYIYEDEIDRRYDKAEYIKDLKKMLKK